jgi:quinohemoprotein ethanol dehydrogenase
MASRGKIVRATIALLTVTLVAGAALLVSPASGASDAKKAATAGIPDFSVADLSASAGDNWLTTGGNLLDDRYSTLADINAGNVGTLTTAWQAHLGIPKKLQGLESQEGNPVAYNGVLYVPDGLSNVYAFDGTNGHLLWKFDSGVTKTFLAANRGLSIGNGMVYAGQGDGSIVALNAATGAVIWRNQIGLVNEGYSFTSPAVYINYPGVGPMVLEGASGGDAGGRSFVIALDATTGLERWRWYVAPGPGEIGSGSWPTNGYVHGGGAIWISPSIDPNLGLLYIVTGNPVPWNGRGPGDNLWTDSIVALHIQNGQFGWGFQTVHHDIWDYDVTNPPVLFDGTYGGQVRHGVAVASKTGWVYILDRATGKPLLGIPEKKVPQIKGEGAGYANLSKTQPYPVGDSFVPQCAQKSWFPGKAPDGKPWSVGCIFTPYTVRASGSYVGFSPGAEGGVDWPPSSYSPQTNLMYLCTRVSTGALGAIPKPQQKLVVGGLYIGVNFAASKVHPDSGRVVAMNLATNKIAWKVDWKKPCFSGMLSTAGNLAFAGQIEQKFTAFNAATGQVLWNSPKLDAGATAPAMSYRAGGKQYIAIMVGGATLAPAKAGDSLYAFALPS